MKIRTAVKNDIKSIKELYWMLDTDAIYYQPEHFIRDVRPDDFLTEIIENEKADFLLIEDLNKVIGFSLIMEKVSGNISCLKPQRYAYILDFVIKEEYRCKGYGTLLLDASKKWASSRKLDFLKLLVFPENHRGIKFYKQNGLKESMISMEYKL